MPDFATDLARLVPRFTGSTSYTVSVSKQVEIHGKPAYSILGFSKCFLSKYIKSENLQTKKK